MHSFNAETYSKSLNWKAEKETRRYIRVYNLCCDIASSVYDRVADNGPDFILRTRIRIEMIIG